MRSLKIAKYWLIYQSTTKNPDWKMVTTDNSVINAKSIHDSIFFMFFLDMFILIYCIYLSGISEY